MFNRIVSWAEASDLILKLANHDWTDMFTGIRTLRKGNIMRRFCAPLLAAVCIGSAASAEPAWVTTTFDLYPALSPDGQVLLFQSNRSGRLAIYRSKPDGSEVRVLLDSGDGPVTPAWSPDGRMIAYSAVSADGGRRDIYVINADGTQRRRLTADPAFDIHPTWSPDGQRVYFNSSRTTPLGSREEQNDVFSVRLDGSDLRQHTHCAAVCTYPAVSPDGRRLAYRKEVAGPGLDWDLSPAVTNSEIMVANIDGGGETNLSRNAAFDGWPTWSLDGERVLFASNRAGPENTGQIYSVRPDGSGLRQLTTGAWGYAQPREGVDGRIYVYKNFEHQGIEFGFIGAFTIE